MCQKDLHLCDFYSQNREILGAESSSNQFRYASNKEKLDMIEISIDNISFQSKGSEIIIVCFLENNFPVRYRYVISSPRSTTQHE